MNCAAFSVNAVLYFIYHLCYFDHLGKKTVYVLYNIHSSQPRDVVATSIPAWLIYRLAWESQTM